MTPRPLDLLGRGGFFVGECEKPFGAPVYLAGFLSLPRQCFLGIPYRKSALGVWFAAVYLHVRFTLKWTGERLAWFAIVAMPLALFALIGIPLAFKTPHAGIGGLGTDL